jgi:Peptidase family M23
MSTPVRTVLAVVALASAPIAGVAGGGSSSSPGSPRGPSAVPAYGAYSWPVQGPVIRGFEPPSDPYGPGHRGIDIGAPFGSELRAASDGVVAFAGWVGGSLFISIDHSDGVRTTYSWLSAVSVARGDTVSEGQVIGATGHGHPDVAEPHLHFGARVGDTYIDPMTLLEPGDVSGLIHLAPLGGPRFAPGPRPPPKEPVGHPGRTGPGVPYSSPVSARLVLSSPTAFVWIWQTRDSVTPRTSPISDSVRPSK